MGPQESNRECQKTQGYVSRSGNDLRGSFSNNISRSDHSAGESRYITFGLSLQRRLIVTSHTERLGMTRIINARLMDRKERKIYEED